MDDNDDKSYITFYGDGGGTDLNYKLLAVRRTSDVYKYNNRVHRVAITTLYL